MIRPFKTWILFAVTLAVTVQPTFAGKRNNGSRSFGGNFSQPAVRAPVATSRVNAGNSLGQIQPTKPRTPAVVNGTSGGTFRSALPALTPQTGTQNGIISRGQVPGAARDLIGDANKDKIISRPFDREPIVAVGNLKSNSGGKTLTGLDPARFTDIRGRIDDRNLGAAAGNSLPGQGGLSGVPTTGRREFHPGFGTGIGGRTAEQQLVTDRPFQDDIPTNLRPGVGGNGLTPITGTVLDGGSAPVDEVGTVMEELVPVVDGVGTVMEELVPIGNGTPSPGPALPPATPPVDAHDGHQRISDLVSIIDAVSGLVGAVGSVSGSSPSYGGGDGGYTAPTDSGFSGSPAAEPLPAPAVESAARTIAEPIAVAESKELDIELTDVRLVDAGSLEQKTGPRLRLTYRNKGAVEAPKFHVTVAVDAGPTLTETAEIVTVEAVGLKPGKSLMVDVRLPVEVLKMATDKSGKAAPFVILAAVLDSDESLEETNEENNVMILAREEIKPIEKSSVAKK